MQKFYYIISKFAQTKLHFVFLLKERELVALTNKVSSKEVLLYSTLENCISLGDGIKEKTS